MQYVQEEESIGPNDQLWVWGCNGMGEDRFLPRVIECVVESLTKKTAPQEIPAVWWPVPAWGRRCSLIDCYDSMSCKIIQMVSLPGKMLQ